MCNNTYLRGPSLTTRFPLSGFIFVNFFSPNDGGDDDNNEAAVHTYIMNITYYYYYYCIRAPLERCSHAQTRARTDARALCYFFKKNFIIIIYFAPRHCPHAHTLIRRPIRHVKYRMSLAQSAINLPPKKYPLRRARAHNERLYVYVQQQVHLLYCDY